MKIWEAWCRWKEGVEQEGEGRVKGFLPKGGGKRFTGLENEGKESKTKN